MNKCISYNEKEELSLKMRNSVEASSKNYYKILDDRKLEEVVKLIQWCSLNSIITIYLNSLHISCSVSIIFTEILLLISRIKKLF